MDDLYISRDKQEYPENNPQYPVYPQYQPIPPQQQQYGQPQQQYDYQNQYNYQQQYEPQQQSPNDDKKKKKKKKRKHILIKLISAILILAVIINGGIILLISSSGYSQSDYEDYRYVSYADLNKDNRIINILLIGADDDSGGSSRSDSMILLSLDYKNYKIKMTSFLRDCWVEIPSTGKSAKLNAAYSKGGAQLLCDTIEYNFKVDINHYIKVDFEMFTKIIDDIGGVDVEVTEEESDYINSTTKQTVGSGKSVHLNGDEALVYARIRKLDSDYSRTERQRKIISALIEKATETKVSELLSIMKEVMPLIESDMTPITITGLLYMGGFASISAFNPVFKKYKFTVEQLQMPDKEDKDPETMTEGYVGSQWVELPNLDVCVEKLKDFIYE